MFKIFFVITIFWVAPLANNLQYLLGYAVCSQCDCTDDEQDDCLQEHAYRAAKTPIVLPFALLPTKVVVPKQEDLVR